MVIFMLHSTIKLTCPFSTSESQRQPSWDETGGERWIATTMTDLGSKLVITTRSQGTGMPSDHLVKISINSGNKGQCRKWWEEGRAQKNVSGFCHGKSEGGFSEDTSSMEQTRKE